MPKIIEMLFITNLTASASGVTMAALSYAVGSCHIDASGPKALHLNVAVSNLSLGSGKII
jgi:hypothetical protein